MRLPWSWTCLGACIHGAATIWASAVLATPAHLSKIPPWSAVSYLANGYSMLPHAPIPDTPWIPRTTCTHGAMATVGNSVPVPTWFHRIPPSPLASSGRLLPRLLILPRLRQRLRPLPLPWRSPIPPSPLRRPIWSSTPKRMATADTRSWLRQKPKAARQRGPHLTRAGTQTLPPIGGHRRPSTMWDPVRTREPQAQS